MADSPSPAEGSKKKPISLSINGKSFLKLHASPREVLRLLKSLPKSNDEDAGDSALDALLDAMPATSYEEGLGKDFKDLERGLAAGPPARQESDVEETPKEEAADKAAAEQKPAECEEPKGDEVKQDEAPVKEAPTPPATVTEEDTSVDAADDVSVKSSRSLRSLKSLKKKLSRKKKKKGTKSSSKSESAAKSEAGDEEMALASKVTFEDDEIEVESLAEEEPAEEPKAEEPTNEPKVEEPIDEPEVEETLAKEMTAPLPPIQEDVNMEPNIEVVNMGDRDAIGFCTPEPEEKEEEEWGVDLGAAAYNLSLMIDGAVVQSLSLGTEAMNTLSSWAQAAVASAPAPEEAKEEEKSAEPAGMQAKEAQEVKDAEEEGEEAEPTPRKTHYEVDDDGKILSVTPSPATFDDVKVADVDGETPATLPDAEEQESKSSKDEVEATKEETNEEEKPADEEVKREGAPRAEATPSNEDVSLEPNIEVVGMEDRDAIGFCAPEPEVEEEVEEEPGKEETSSNAVELTERTSSTGSHTSATSQKSLFGTTALKKRIGSFFGSAKGGAAKEVEEDRNDVNGEEANPTADEDEAREDDGRDQNDSIEIVFDDDEAKMLASGKPGSWKEATDPKTNKAYCYNKKTKETSWTKPQAVLL